MSAGAVPNVEAVTRYYTTKHSWRGKYKRMMAIGKLGVQTINPSSWEVTNTWPYGDDVTDIMPSAKTPNEFTLATNKGGCARLLLPSHRERERERETQQSRA